MNIQELQQRHSDAMVHATRVAERLQAAARSEGRSLGPGEQQANHVGKVVRRIGDQTQRAGNKPVAQLHHHKEHINSSANREAAVEAFRDMVMVMMSVRILRIMRM